jgi:hypothetical protein
MYNEMRNLVREDAKRGFRLSQIENEGNDPIVTGQSFGTPHDLASMYGTRERGDVPTGYDERDPQPEGRPREKMSILGTQNDPVGGIDRLGVHGMKGGYPSDNENVKEGISKTQMAYLKNMKALGTIQKTLLSESVQEVDLLNENNIKEDLDN